MDKKRVRSLLLVGQVAVALLLLWMLYRSMNTQPNLGIAWATLKVRLVHVQPHLYLAPLLLLLPNLLLETAKWYVLLPKDNPVTFARAFRAVLAGLGLAIATPQRIGEYGGRILLLPPAVQWRGLNAKIAGNVAQVLVTIGFGSPAAFWLGLNMGLVTLETVFWSMALHVLFISVSIYLFLKPVSLKKRLSTTAWPENIRRMLRRFNALFQFRFDHLALVLLLATLRYAVYCTQYVLLLKLFGIDMPLSQAYAGVGAIFFCQTLLPLTNLAGLAIRSNLAVWVWGFFGADPVNSLAAALFLWIINLVLPAFIGTFCLFGVQIPSSKVL